VNARTLSSAIMLAMLPSASTTENTRPQSVVQQLSRCETAPLQNVEQFVSVHTTSVCLPSEPAEKVAAVLSYYGLSADSITEMPEGSQLFDFSQGVEAWVEVDPNKDIVVVVKDGEFRDLYEFTTDNIHLLPKILNNAGVRGRL